MHMQNDSLIDGNISTDDDPAESDLAIVAQNPADPTSSTNQGTQVHRLHTINEVQII